MDYVDLFSSAVPSGSGAFQMPTRPSSASSSSSSASSAASTLIVIDTIQILWFESYFCISWGGGGLWLVGCGKRVAKMWDFQILLVYLVLVNNYRLIIKSQRRALKHTNSTSYGHGTMEALMYLDTYTSKYGFSP